jgi:hypothetical protein
MTMMNLNPHNLTIETKARHNELLREAEQKRLARTALNALPANPPRWQRWTMFMGKVVPDAPLSNQTEPRRATS